MEDVRNWLRGCGLEEYATTFQDEGWDDLEILLDIEEENLRECIPKPGHRKKFTLAARDDGRPNATINFCPNMEDVRYWLRGYGLDEYASKFEEEGWDNRNILFDIDEESLKICIGKPGHRQKFKRAMIKTNADDRRRETDEKCTEMQVASAHTLDRLQGLATVVVGVDTFRQLVPSRQITEENSTNIIGSWVYPEERPGPRDCFRTQMETIMKDIQEKDGIYVETSAFGELDEIINYCHLATIIGASGDGKTAMAYHLSLKYIQQGYDYLELHFAQEWKDYVDGSSGKGSGMKQFVLIDNIFGRLSVDEKKLNEWNSIFELMQKIVEQRQGDLIVICTCRKHVFMDAEPKISSFPFFQSHKVIDMTSKPLTVDEKLKIWNNYRNKYQVNCDVSDSIKEDIQTPQGFPQCVVLFCTSIKLQKEGGCFFANPMKYIQGQLTDFANNDKIKYFALLLVLLHKNKLPKLFLAEISDHKKEIKRICEATGLKTRPGKDELKQALRSLRNTYITEFDQFYKLSHDSVRENLALLFIKSNTDYAIQALDFFYLTDHTRCQGQTANYEKLVYILPREKTVELIKRMIKEIKTGNVVAVCAHQAWQSVSFVEEFLTCTFGTVEKSSEENNADLYSIKEIFDTKDSSTSCIFYFNLLEALEFFGHKNAKTTILNKGEMKYVLQDVKPASIEAPLDRLLSLKLSRIMNTLGASEESRQIQMRSAITMEILDTLCTKIAGREFSCYIFGSQAEGTHVPTQISKPDASVSYLFCLENCEVLHHISEAKADKSVDLLTVSDENINMPGYVKLQVVLNGEAQTKDTCKNIPENTKLDYKDRVCVHREHPGKIRVDIDTGSATTTNIIAGDPVDICYSYRCKTWPDIARRWQNRVRHHNWPSRYALEQMKALSAFLVPVGCHDSIEKHLEWKTCFLLQERQLMCSLNETQHKCYILLKMINNNIISYYLKQHANMSFALASYHLKTCIFHAVENSPEDMWVPEKLLYCVRQCLNCILKWTVKGNCENYFIPEENMFSRRIHGEIQSKLREILELLLSSEFEYLLQIRCGNVGLCLGQSMIGLPIQKRAEQILAPDHVSMHLDTVRLTVLVKDRILSKCYEHEPQACVSHHLATVAMLRRTKTKNITEHSTEETKNSISLVLPWVELSLMNNLMTLAANKSRQLHLDVLFSQRWHEISMISNSFSAKLKQATYLHLAGFLSASLQILETLSVLLGPGMISICGCRNLKPIILDDETKATLKGKSEEDFRLKYSMPCLVFLPTEIVPAAIRHEMERDIQYRFGKAWAVLDSKVLLHYILYLNHAELEMSTEANRDIDNLDSVLKTDPNLGHRDTGFNILGWIYKQEGCEHRAEECFNQSLLETDKYCANVAVQKTS